MRRLLNLFSGLLHRTSAVSVETINPEDGLLRRVLIDPSYIKPDGSISSLAFKPRKADTDGLSVDLERLTTHQKAIVDSVKFRLARLIAQVPLNLGLTCVHDPREGNAAHSLIQGKFTSGVCRKLASAAKLLRV